MAKQGTFFDPTMEALKDAIARAQKLGVRIVAGSDTGYGPASIGRVSIEVANLVESGLSPLQALQAATLVNAQMLMKDKQIGQLVSGFDADLIVVERNPLEYVGTLQDPLLVVSNGRIGLDRLNFAR